jgi:hypothetical protein
MKQTVASSRSLQSKGRAARARSLSPGRWADEDDEQ